MFHPTSSEEAIVKQDSPLAAKVIPAKTKPSEEPPEEPPEEPRTYSFEEAMEASLEAFRGDRLAADVWVRKYALKDSEGRYLEREPADMHRRLAREFARIEEKHPNPLSFDKIFSFLEDWRIIPQGSPMSGVGNPFRIQSISNCFVVDSPADSYGGILRADEQEAQIMKRRGGVGFDISTIRPKGLSTTNSAQTTDGIGVFMERYSHTCGEVGQGGRRGALMLTCDVHHPEILTFIRIKNQKRACKKCGHEERDKVTRANVSIRLSDDFLQAVEAGKKYQLRWPCDNRTDPAIEEWVDAREIWQEIVQNARDSAEPGLLFWDNILRESPADCYADVGYRTVSTNPCSEIPLSVNDSCRLMLVNLAKFVVDPFTPHATFNWEGFEEATRVAQRLMDDIVDLEIEQIDKILTKIDMDPEDDEDKRVERKLWKNIRQAAVNGRRTGLGVTAVGDTLAMLGHRYGSEDSIEVAEQLYRSLAVASYRSSIELAAERGSFPVYDLRKEREHPFVNRVLEAGGPELRRLYEQHGRRNIACLTTAPTGSTSILAQTTSGIEPVFKAFYIRKKKVNSSDEDARVDEVDSQGDKWTHFVVREHGFLKWQQVTGKTEEDFEQSPYYKAEAEELDWTQRVRLQAAANRWVDHAISSTLNLPEDVTVDEVKDIYVAAWKHGCKGITVYRKNCRDGVIVESVDSASTFLQHSAPKRPEKMPCHVHRTRIRTGHETFEDWIFFVGLFDGQPFEIFGGSTENVELPRKVREGWIVKRSFKSGGKYDFYYGEDDDPCKIKDIVRLFDNPDRGWATRMVSLALRHGAPIQYIAEQLSRDKKSDMYDFAKSIARVLKGYIPDGTATAVKLCPECGAEDSLVYQEGCLRCRDCGHSKCG